MFEEFQMAVSSAAKPWMLPGLTSANYVAMIKGQQNTCHDSKGMVTGFWRVVESSVGAACSQ